MTMSSFERTSALATALMNFLDLTGGADGTSCGRGDPSTVRASAITALENAGYRYGPADGSPGLEFKLHDFGHRGLTNHRDATSFAVKAHVVFVDGEPMPSLGKPRLGMEELVFPTLPKV